MEKIVSWNFGMFSVSVLVSTEVDGEAAEYLLEAAALNILQRGPAGSVEKTLAIREGLWATRNTKGELVRPPKFERSSIPFSAENAEIVKAGFTLDHDLAPDGAPAVWLSCKCVSVIEKVDASADSKFVEERKVVARWATTGTPLPEKAKTSPVAFAGDCGTFDEPSKELLTAIRAFVREEEKKRRESL